jgi:hypothetical protein
VATAEAAKITINVTIDDTDVDEDVLATIGEEITDM